HYVAANPDTVETAAGPDTFVFRLLAVHGLPCRVHLSVSRGQLEAALCAMNATAHDLDRQLSPLLANRPPHVTPVAMTRDEVKAAVKKAMGDVLFLLAVLEPTLDTDE